MSPAIVALFAFAWVGVLIFQLWMQFSPGRKKKRALVDAIGSGDLAAVQEIVSNGLSPNFNYWSHISWLWMGSPLSLAAHKMGPSIADFLIANGASIAPRSPGNETLLSNAVGGGNFKLIDIALAAGHDIHFQPEKQSKPLAKAIHHQMVPMARFLISRGASKEDLTAGDCRWHAMNSETILFVQEIGMDVPPDILRAARNGEWDLPGKPA